MSSILATATGSLRRCLGLAQALAMRFTSSRDSDRVHKAFPRDLGLRLKAVILG